MIGHAGPMPGRACMRCGSVNCAGADCREDGLDWEARLVRPAPDTFTPLCAPEDASCEHGTPPGDWCLACDSVCVNNGEIPF